MIKLTRQKTFALQQNNLSDIETYSDKGTRYYRVGNHSYPSITSVLGYFKAHAIQEWRNRVGANEANKISGRASRRGTTIHDMVEKYLKNEYMSLITEKRSLPDIDMFKRMMPTLSRIDNIIVQEQALYSRVLEIAGRVDLIAEFDGVPSIIDFKTSLKEKREEYIKDYYEQATAYSLMYEDMTGRTINQIVIIIASDESPEPQVFVSKIEEHSVSLARKIEEFHKRNTN